MRKSVLKWFVVTIVMINIACIASVAQAAFPDDLNLIVAAENGNKAKVEMLISDGANVNVERIDGITPLYAAASNGHKDIVELLIIKGADVNAKSSDGTSPLHEAIRLKHKNVAMLLISKGANVNAKTSQGETPLYWAAYYGQKDVVKMLISKGADVNVKNVYGATPLYVAAPMYIDIVRLLINKGADVNVRISDGTSPLYQAAYSRREDIVELLISKGANVNVKNEDDRTPLHCVAYNGDEHIAELLISKGANINARTKQGKTPLHDAVESRHKDMVMLLIKKGADLSVKNNDGKTALNVAEEREYYELAVLLRIYGVKSVKEMWTKPVIISECETNEWFEGLYTNQVLCYFGGLMASAEKLSGMSVFLATQHMEGSGADTKEDFRHLNKDFVIWVKENSIPVFDDVESGRSAKKIYERYMKGTAREYYEAHESLMLNPEYRILLEDIAAGKKVGIGHTRLHNSLKYGYKDKQADAFWIRRAIDGTEAELFKALEKLLETYDATYLDVNRKRFSFISQNRGFRGLGGRGYDASRLPDFVVFVGDIAGKYKVSMRLGLDGDNVSGSYRNESVGKDIMLKGTLDKDGNLHIKEYSNGDGTHSGMFDGKWIGRSIIGTWSGHANKRLEFSLERTYNDSMELEYKTWHEAVKTEGHLDAGEGVRLAGITLANGDKVAVGLQHYLKKDHESKMFHMGVGGFKAFLLPGNPELVYVLGKFVPQGVEKRGGNVYKIYVKGNPDSVLFVSCGYGASSAGAWSQEVYDFYYSGDTLKVFKSSFVFGEDDVYRGDGVTYDKLKRKRFAYDEVAELSYNVVDGKRLELKKAVLAKYSVENVSYSDVSKVTGVGDEKIEFEVKELSLSEAAVKYPVETDILKYDGYCD